MGILLKPDFRNFSIIASKLAGNFSENYRNYIKGEVWDIQNSAKNS